MSAPNRLIRALIRQIRCQCHRPIQVQDQPIQHLNRPSRSRVHSLQHQNRYTLCHQAAIHRHVHDLGLENFDGTDVLAINPNWMDYSLAWSWKRRTIAHTSQCTHHRELARTRPYESFLGSSSFPLCTDRSNRCLWHHAVACEAPVRNLLPRVSPSARARTQQLCSREPR
jgi:hypothetical protein